LHAIRAIPSIASGRPRARRHIVHLPRLAPTEGIQPSIIKDIGRVIRGLADRGMPWAGGRRPAIVLVEQYYDFAAELADRYLVMERGEFVQRGAGRDMAADRVRERMSI
jgi:urea transport system ATP-binding protein